MNDKWRSGLFWWVIFLIFTLIIANIDYYYVITRAYGAHTDFDALRYGLWFFWIFQPLIYFAIAAAHFQGCERRDKSAFLWSVRLFLTGCLTLISCLSDILTYVIYGWDFPLRGWNWLFFYVLFGYSISTIGLIIWASFVLTIPMWGMWRLDFGREKMISEEEGGD